MRGRRRGLRDGDSRPLSRLLLYVLILVSLAPSSWPTTLLCPSRCLSLTIDILFKKVILSVPTRYPSNPGTLSNLPCICFLDGVPPPYCPPHPVRAKPPQPTSLYTNHLKPLQQLLTHANVPIPLIAYNTSLVLLDTNDDLTKDPLRFAITTRPCSRVPPCASKQTLHQLAQLVSGAREQ